MNNNLPDIHYLLENYYEDLIVKLAFDENYDFDINKTNYYYKTALMKTTDQKGYENIAKLLLKHPNIKVNLQAKNGMTALMYTSIIGYENMENMVKLLLAHPDIKVNLQDTSGITALMFAVSSSKDNENIVKLLLAHPDINVNLQSNNDRWTALDYASTDEKYALIMAKAKAN